MLKPSAQRLIRYGALVVAALVVVGGVIHVFNRPGVDPVATAEPAPRQAKPAADDEALSPSEAAIDRAMRLIGEGRRLGDEGKFDEANAKLDQAEKAVPGLSETADTRRRLAETSTPEGRFATQLARARTAIGNDDDAAASASA